MVVLPPPGAIVVTYMVEGGAVGPPGVPLQEETVATLVYVVPGAVPRVWLP